MGVNSLPKTVTRQRRDCDLNPDPSAPETSTLTTRLLTYFFEDIVLFGKFLQPDAIFRLRMHKNA